MYAKYALFDSAKGAIFERLMIQMKDPTDAKGVKDFLKTLRQSISSDRDSNISIYNYLDSQETLNKINLILNIIFNVIIAITMFLCFFSLSSSMSANLYEQSKEIGIMRATGLTKKKVYLLYIYEAFILVLSSSLLGICIGTVVGFSMTLQQTLFTDIPI
jgi:ABC-type antimicrobial peptide transport system permease subunit